ncbi:hypothetical protein CDAR_174271 [Caerostris darwini]|uniref:Uncharacterized protein n=1 Tax=Caerostris darwini TaxID=1538125 RepID=A0AAV4VJ23_9ARAC|nr:hypothetical protein CDAR_174271 [Caerostris darwini]
MSRTSRQQQLLHNTEDKKKKRKKNPLHLQKRKEALLACFVEDLSNRDSGKAVKQFLHCDSLREGCFLALREKREIKSPEYVHVMCTPRTVADLSRKA